MCRREVLSVCQADGSGKEELPSPNPAVQWIVNVMWKKTQIEKKIQKVDTFLSILVMLFILQGWLTNLSFFQGYKMNTRDS